MMSQTHFELYFKCIQNTRKQLFVTEVHIVLLLHLIVYLG